MTVAEKRPVLFHFRRDLRLGDHPGFTAACASGVPVIPLFILAQATDALGAAPKWRLGLALAELQRRLRALGSDLVLRRGEPHASRYYLRETVYGNEARGHALAADGIHYTTHPGFLLHEPWSVETGSGSFYKVYTPFWRVVAAPRSSDASSASARTRRASAFRNFSTARSANTRATAIAPTSRRLRGCP
jgi:deoxyribodipyrimidine photo-lyase